MKTNVYKRFDPPVMESEERIGINRGLPMMGIDLIRGKYDRRHTFKTSKNGDIQWI